LTDARATALVSAAALALALAACGGGSSSSGRVAIRVGDATIRAGDVRRQMQADASGGEVPDAPRFARCIARLRAQQSEMLAEALVEECRSRYESLRARALTTLISSRWLVGEARERGLRLPGGDPVQQARAAEAALREMLLRGAPKVSQAQVVAYYEQNQAQFGRPERRYLDIVERIPTRAQAQAALNAAVRRGDIHRIAIHEEFAEQNLATVVARKRSILKAIFAAVPHTIVGPLPLNEKWCFFEVRRVVPRDVKPLAQVQSAIVQALEAERLRRALTPFVAAWRRKWIARTHCAAAYLVQQCSEYRGRRTPEAPTSFA
jgi:hypothetical protein